MARGKRVKIDDRDALYHVTSRITGQRMLLRDDGTKRDMLDALRRSAEFSGVDVGAFALMDNHFHIVLRVPRPAGTVPEGEVLRRYGALAGRTRMECLAERVVRLRDGGDALGAEALLERLRARMHDLSQFVKTFKEEFGRRFRARNPYSGTIWGGRFKSTLVEEAEYLRACAEYVELNPVRAGLSRRAEDYAWNTVGAAARGDAFALRCRRWLLGVLGGCGDRPLDEGALMKRQPQIGSGRIFGSAGFVQAMLWRFADSMRSSRAKPRKVGGNAFASHGWMLAGKRGNAA